MAISAVGAFSVNVAHTTSHIFVMFEAQQHKSGMLNRQPSSHALLPRRP